MSTRHTRRSGLRKKFTGSPLTLPQLNTSAVAIDIEYSPRTWSCFGGPLTPLSSASDHDFNVPDIEVDRFERPLTPFPSKGDYLLSLGLDDGQVPPGLTWEETYETFNGPLTPLGSDVETEEAGRGESISVASTSQALPTTKGNSDTYIKPQGSMFDAAHACGWFPDPPSVPESEIVVSDFADLRKMMHFPPSAWKLGRDGRLVRDYGVIFENPSVPIAGPLPLAGIMEREMRALMRQKEEIMRALEDEGEIVMPGIDDVLGSEDQRNPDFEDTDKNMVVLNMPKPLGPERTEIYDGVNDYPEEWASHQSTRLCYHPTEEMFVE